MANIPLEDSFADVIGKAQRGLKITDDTLSARAGISVEQITKLKSGELDETAAMKIAPALNLSPAALVELGKKSWYPPDHSVHGLAAFNTPFEDMTVNAYLLFDSKTKEAVAFDTGASATPMLDFAKQNSLKINLVLLTHIHPDHIADLEKLKKETGAPAFVCELEPTSGAQIFKIGKEFSVGTLKIQARQTSGHARGGTTFFVTGLEKPVAVVGDAIFCCSMGGGMVSYEEALRTNRENIFSLPDETILCPGHGPLTTVGEQKEHNPFFPEFKK
jgi:glyoxylase-like metal-dependent hydrolase (beta-lactamase superfamily II)